MGNTIVGCAGNDTLQGNGAGSHGGARAPCSVQARTGDCAEPYGKRRLGTTLRYPYEVRNAADYFEDLPDVTVAPDPPLDFLIGSIATAGSE
jgi:hypothetical protein